MKQFHFPVLKDLMGYFGPGQAQQIVVAETSGLGLHSDPVFGGWDGTTDQVQNGHTT